MGVLRRKQTVTIQITALLAIAIETHGAISCGSGRCYYTTLFFIRTSNFGAEDKHSC